MKYIISTNYAPSREDTIINAYNTFIKPYLVELSGFLLGEIIQLTYKTTNPLLRLLDHNNILKQAEYPDLFKLIGTQYTNYYKNLKALNPNLNITLCDEATEFMLPDLSGKYIVQRKEDVKIELTNPTIQSFKISIDGSFAKLSPLSSATNSFKAAEENDELHLVATSNGISSITLTSPLPVDNVGLNVNIGDKSVYFYMKVKNYQ